MTEVLRSSQYPRGMLMAAGAKTKSDYGYILKKEPVLFIIELMEGVRGRQESRTHRF